MEIIVNENVKIEVDGRNYTLLLKRLIKSKKKSLPDKEIFVVEGYFTNVAHALERALTVQTHINNEGERLTIEQYIKELKQVAADHVKDLKKLTKNKV